VAGYLFYYPGTMFMALFPPQMARPPRRWAAVLRARHRDSPGELPTRAKLSEQFLPAVPVLAREAPMVPHPFQTGGGPTSVRTFDVGTRKTTSSGAHEDYSPPPATTLPSRSPHCKTQHLGGSSIRIFLPGSRSTSRNGLVPFGVFTRSL